MRSQLFAYSSFLLLTNREYLRCRGFAGLKYFVDARLLILKRLTCLTEFVLFNVVEHLADFVRVYSGPFSKPFDLFDDCVLHSAGDVSLSCRDRRLSILAEQLALRRLTCRSCIS